MPALILISGGTGSGKTTLAGAIAEKYAHKKTALIALDNYYFDLSMLSEEETVDYNFDHPDAIDIENVTKDTSRLLEGENVSIPVYNFRTYRRDKKMITVDPSEIIIIEGIFALHYPELNRLARLKIYVETDSDIRLVRRIRRDINERGYSLEPILNRYINTARPMHDKFIEPSKKNADVIISGEDPIDHIMEKINI